MIEIWTDIKDYEGHYQMSNLNNYRSIKKGRIKILKLGNVNGRPCLNLSKNGLAKTLYFNKIYRKKNEGYITGDKIKNITFIAYIDRIGGIFEIAVFECPVCQKYYKTTFNAIFNKPKSCGCIRRDRVKITPELVLEILKKDPFITTIKLGKIFNVSQSWASYNKKLAFKLM